MPPSPNLKSQFVSAQFGFDASWEIDLFGYQRRISEGAQARSEAMQAHVHDARLSLQAEVVRNALEWRVGQQRLQLARVQLAQLDDQLQMTQAARKAGEATQQDLLRSQTLRDSFAATLPLLELGARQSLAALSTLTAVPVQTLEAQLHDVRLPDVPAPPSAGVPAELLRNRPDIRASERDLAGASADVGVAVAAQYPRLSLSGNAGWNAIQTHALFDGRSEFWSLGPKLNLPLFNSGRLREQVKANEAALDVAKAGYRKTLVGALADVEVALARMSRNETRRQQMLQLQAQQDEVLRLTQVQFDAGEVARSSLVEAQRGLVNAQDQSLQAQGQSLAAWVALYKALGGTQ